jgi:hypothetical protein
MQTPPPRLSCLHNEARQLPMMPRSSSIPFGLAPAWLAACALLATGCGGGSTLPARGTVSGKVTLDGKPLKQGQGHVMFVPDATKGTKGPPAIGVTDAEGIYTLSTDREAGSEDGAIVGFHRVRISEVPNPEKPDAPLTIPAKYGNEATSGFSFEVKPGDNPIQLDLKSR